MHYPPYFNKFSNNCLINISVLIIMPLSRLAWFEKGFGNCLENLLRIIIKFIVVFWKTNNFKCRIQAPCFRTPLLTLVWLPACPSLSDTSLWWVEVTWPPQTLVHSLGAVNITLNMWSAFKCWSILFLLPNPLKPFLERVRPLLHVCVMLWVIWNVSVKEMHGTYYMCALW